MSARIAATDMGIGSRPGSPSPELKSATSMQILKPGAWVPTKPRPARGETETILEQLSKALIEIFCNRDFSNPLMAHAAPNFQAWLDYNGSQVRSLEEHIAFHKWMCRTNPGYEYDVLAVLADVDEDKGLASVWATLRVTGHPVKIQRESVTRLWWRRKEGRWKCYKQFGLRGVAWFADLHGGA